MSRFWFFFIFCVGLGSCGVNHREDEGLDGPPDLVELSENALHCLRDVEFTHFERSEHCVLVAEEILASHERHCMKRRSEECQEWNEIKGVYVTAIAESLFNHGKSEELGKIHDAGWAWSIYLDGETMRALFEECLKNEEDKLAEVGLQKAHEVIIVPLKEWQMCFRKGYPEFNTAEV